MNLQLVKLEDLNLKVGAYNFLKKNGFKTLKDILALTKEEIISLEGSKETYVEDILQLTQKVSEENFDLTLTTLTESEIENLEKLSAYNVDPSASVWTTGFSLQTFNFFKRNGVLTIGDLILLDKEDFSQKEGAGNKVCSEVQDFLNKVQVIS